jgi:hypothetical protein
LKSRFFLALGSACAVALAVVASCDLAFPLHELGDAASVADAGEAGGACRGLKREACIECCQTTYPGGGDQLLAAQWKCVCMKDVCVNDFTCNSKNCDETPPDGGLSCPGCVVSQTDCPLPSNLSAVCSGVESCNAFESCVIGCPKIAEDGDH